MRIFKETQAFRQWWIMLIAVITGSGLTLAMINQKGKSGNLIPIILLLVLASLILVMIWRSKLKTRIDPSGIKTVFEPFGFTRKEFLWNDISKCYVRKYSAITEYGGWGIRGLGKAKAYNVSGNMGIQIITKNNRKFLIGTQQPEQAEKAIKRYKEKIT